MIECGDDTGKSCGRYTDINNSKYTDNQIGKGVGVGVGVGVGKTRKKRKQLKTKEVRQQETDVIRNQIMDLGLADGNIDVARVFTELRTFVDMGYSWSGKIPLHGFNRMVEVVLTTNPNITCRVALLYDKSI